MTDEKPTVLTSQIPRVREYLDRVVAEAVNEAAKSLADIRAWCDRTESETREWMTKHNPVCECEVGETYLNAVDQVRALLPSLPEAGEVTTVDVNPGTENDDDRDRELD